MSVVMLLRNQLIKVNGGSRVHAFTMYIIRDIVYTGQILKICHALNKFLTSGPQ